MTDKREPTEEELRDRIVRHALGLLENAEQLRELKKSDRKRTADGIAGTAQRPLGNQKRAGAELPSPGDGSADLL